MNRLWGFHIDKLLSLCDLEVGERFPAPTQNLKALGENRHLLQSAWIMAHLLGANRAEAPEPGEMATQTTTAGATQRWQQRLANLVKIKMLHIWSYLIFLKNNLLLCWLIARKARVFLCDESRTSIWQGCSPLDSTHWATVTPSGYYSSMIMLLPYY